MTEPVIMLHGLWMRRPALWWLAARLRSAGFAPSLFAYASLWGSPDAAQARLADRVRDAGPGPVHLVGHSLGGIIALAALRKFPDLPPGRVVCLGSPIAGSAAARALRERRIALLGGRSRALLERGVLLPEGREIGMIAGTRGIGAGQWLGGLDQAHDGSVALSETRTVGLADHLCLPLGHSALMFSGAVAAHTAHFLRRGCFDPGR